MKQIQLTKHEAKRLLERYYNGDTTNDEERLIRIFLASSAADGGEFNADKAVMGFLCTKRAKCHRTKATRWIPLAAAASIVMAIGLWTFVHLTTPDYIAYVNGQEYTNEQFVINHMEQTMKFVGNETESLTIENQMKAVFKATDNN